MLQAEANLARIAEGQMACLGNCSYSSQMREPVEQFRLDGIPLKRVGVTDMIEDSPYDKGVLWIESEGRVEKAGKAA